MMRGNLGARWLTPVQHPHRRRGQRTSPPPCSTRPPTAAATATRSLSIGEKHHDPVEQITLTRMSATLLTLDFGKPPPEGEPSPWRETYELVDTVRAKAAASGQGAFPADRAAFQVTAPPSACATTTSSRTGPCAGEEVLSDIISKQGETIVAHAGTQIDALIPAAFACALGNQGRQAAAPARCLRPRRPRRPDRRSGRKRRRLALPVRPPPRHPLHRPHRARHEPRLRYQHRQRRFTPKRSANGRTTAATTPGSNGTRNIRLTYVTDAHRPRDPLLLRHRRLHLPHRVSRRAARNGSSATTRRTSSARSTPTAAASTTVTTTTTTCSPTPAPTAARSTSSMTASTASPASAMPKAAPGSATTMRRATWSRKSDPRGNKTAIRVRQGRPAG